MGSAIGIGRLGAILSPVVSGALLAIRTKSGPGQRRATAAASEINRL
jgi:hypothetical protein